MCRRAHRRRLPCVPVITVANDEVMLAALDVENFVNGRADACIFIGIDLGSVASFGVDIPNAFTAACVAETSKDALTCPIPWDHGLSDTSRRGALFSGLV